MNIKVIKGKGQLINNIPFAKAVIEIDGKDFDCFIACSPIKKC